MPIIKSAKKRMRQNIKRRKRNFPVRSLLKSTFKKALALIKEGKLEEAKKFIAYAYSVIDVAAKKKIIHEKNAARKKSRIARALNHLEKHGVKKSAAKPKKAEKKEEKVEAKAEEPAKEEAIEEKAA